MRVGELAKELDVPSQLVLETLRSLRLKAKDDQQELNAAVLPVLKSEIKKRKAALPVAKETKEPVKEVKSKESPKTETKAKEKAAAPVKEEKKTVARNPLFREKKSLRLWKKYRLKVKNPRIKSRRLL